jgi:EpsI family protein
MRKGAWLVPLALLVQAGFMQWAAADERPPAIPDFSSFAAQLGPWQLLREDPIDLSVRRELQADQVISRTYSTASGQTPANLFVAWFQTQTQGARQPHSPQVCLPGAGWTPMESGRLDIGAGGESIPANRFVVANQGQRAVVLYWFQSSRRAIASEWSSKFWTVWDAVAERRTDIALIRVVTWPKDGNYAEATGNGVAFVKDMYPALRRMLPR